jgi:transposase-like protein
MSREGKEMGEAKRNRYTKEFKFKVALEAIKGEKQLSELAAEYKVHAVMISNWKRQLLENGSAVFGSHAQKAEEEQQNVSEDLIRTIGHQQVQIDWLKKKLGLSDSWRGAL